MRKQPSNSAPVICPSTAFINPQDYVLVGPSSNKDVVPYVTDMAKKYPVLKNAYGDLLDCWKHYHPEEK